MSRAHGWKEHAQGLVYKLGAAEEVGEYFSKKELSIFVRRKTQIQYQVVVCSLTFGG